MKLCGIYAIENTVTNKVYIGSSRDIKHRWSSGHLQFLNKGTHTNTHLQNAWNKYGSKNFQWIIVELCNEIDLYEKEQLYLDFLFPSKLLYNFRSIAGHYDSFEQNIDTKIKISNALKNRHFSKEHRENLSIAATGRKMNVEPWNKGKTLSDGHRTKVSNSKSIKLWRFIDPSGKLHEFYNLTKFCKDNNLHQGLMWEVSIGRLNRKQHKGWRVA